MSGEELLVLTRSYSARTAAAAIQPTHSERAPQCSLPESIDSCLSEAQLPAQLRLDDRLVHLPSACCESPVQLG
jgi:hypothetical protein